MKKIVSKFYKIISFINNMYPTPLSINIEDKIFAKYLFLVIAFNNPELIELQIQSLQNKFKPSYKYVIGDNSNNLQSQIKIRSICKKYNVGYIQISKMPFCQKDWKDASLSHGMALNYLWTKMRKITFCDAVWFLDHDIILNKLIKSTEEWDKNLYGVFQERGTMWYMWPGFFGYKLQGKTGCKFDFLPDVNGDTGASNWKKIFSSTAKEEVEIVKQEYCYYDEKSAQIVKYNLYHEGCFELLDDAKWVYMINGSNWKHAEGHMERVENLHKISQLE